jgi:hypothetical protein
MASDMNLSLKPLKNRPCWNSVRQLFTVHLKAAVYHRKVLNLNTPFSIINSPDEAKDGRINLLTTYEEETKIDLGQATPESELQQ